MEASSPNSEQELRKQALIEVKKKRDFVNHAITYGIVNVLLLVIWALTGAGFFWPGFVIAGWGIGLALNAWDVYARKPISEAQIQREAERLRAKGPDH
jgi:2TM domain-containing protein